MAGEMWLDADAYKMVFICIVIWIGMFPYCIGNGVVIVRISSTIIPIRECHPRELGTRPTDSAEI